MRRALARRCLYCGSPGVFEGYFGLRPRCPTCNVKFVREEGYFLGAYALNLVVAFPVILFPLSRTVWIELDLVFHPPGRDPEQQLRGTIAERGDDYPN